MVWARIAVALEPIACAHAPDGLHMGVLKNTATDHQLLEVKTPLIIIEGGALFKKCAASKNI